MSSHHKNAFCDIAAASTLHPLSFSIPYPEARETFCRMIQPCTPMAHSEVSSAAKRHE